MPGYYSHVYGFYRNWSERIYFEHHE